MGVVCVVQIGERISSFCDVGVVLRFGVVRWWVCYPSVEGGNVQCP